MIWSDPIKSILHIVGSSFASFVYKDGQYLISGIHGVRASWAGLLIEIPRAK